jgi:PAS domain S-box-containing protein
MISKNIHKIIWAIISISLLIHFLCLVANKTILQGWQWEHHPVHATVEITGSIIALMVAGLLLSLEKQNKGTNFNIWIAGALIAMGLLDGFHALTHSGNTFVWLHSTATFVGGFLFVLVWLPHRWERLISAWWIPSIAVTTVLLALLSLLFPDALPAMVLENKFTIQAKGLNILGGLCLFIASGRLFLTYFSKHNVDNLLFCLHCLLFGSAAILFEQSELWDIAWWGWHALRFLAYGVAFWFVVLTLQQSQKDITEKIKQNNIELEERVTERTIALENSTQELIQITHQNEMILNAAGEGIYGVDLKGLGVFINPAAAKMLGYEAGELIGQPQHSIIHHTRPDGRPYPAKECPIYTAFKDGNVHHVTDEVFWRKDGTCFPVEYVSTPIVENDALQGAVVTFKDITVHKQNEQQLKESEERIRAILDNAAEGIITINEQGIIESFNPAAEQLFGYTIDKVIGQNIKLLMPEPYRSEHDQHIANYRNTGESKIIGIGREVAAQHKDGSTFPVELAVSETKTDKGSIFTGIVRDLTEQKQAEEQLLAAKKEAERANQAKSIFLANMSHELRTPLNAVLGFSGLMARDSQVTPQQKDSLSVINRSGYHLLSLINDVLDMSKIEAGHTQLEPEPTDLHLLLHDMGDMIIQRIEAKALQFSLELTPALPQYVMLDIRKLRQVLINLLGNAVKFTRAGIIILRADGKNTGADKWKLTFEVEDTGIGIPADKIETIFEPFAQIGHSPAKQQGTGLGLAISHQFIQLMGGDITVESTPDKGSVFRFDIPVETANATEIEHPVKETGQRAVGLAADEPEWRILIVEDEADNRLLLRHLLESVGFNVRIAMNGFEAIQQFKDWQPHLIWMDMRMPVMDGYEATRHIRKLPGGKQIKILALTASVFKEQEDAILAVGFDAVLHKPYNEAAIFNAMAEQLGPHYVYEEDNDLIKQNALPSLSSDDLVNLSEEWLNEFLTATQLGDIEAMLLLTKALPATESETKATLDRYINDFQMDTLIMILEEKRGATQKA